LDFLTKETTSPSDLLKMTTSKNYCQKGPPTPWRQACQTTRVACQGRSPAMAARCVQQIFTTPAAMGRGGMCAWWQAPSLLAYSVDQSHARGDVLIG